MEYLTRIPICCGLFFGDERRRQHLTTTRVSTLELPIEGARSRRPLVLAALFPNEGMVSVVDRRETSETRRTILTNFRLSSPKLEGDEPHDARRLNLKYDPQSKHYVFCEDTPDATACSICMEFLGKWYATFPLSLSICCLERINPRCHVVTVPTDDSATGLCSHAYHRECIMNWLQDDNDACPNCRQPMWDPETYEMIDQCIKDQEWHIPFAVWLRF